MINPKIIEKFLSRQLQSFDWLKSCTPEELDAELRNLKPRPRFGTKLWNHQKAAFLLLNELKRFMLFIDMGGGKAIPVDELVLTPSGWKKMGDLKVGTRVIGSNGKSTRVTGVYPQGVKSVFNVRFSDGAGVRCCKDHLWAVTTPTRKWRGQKNNIKPLSELIGDLRDTNGWRKWFIPVSGPVYFKKRPNLELDPYWLGLWIGDGCRLSASITSGDPEVFKHVVNSLPEGVTIKSSGNSKGSKNYFFTRKRYHGSQPNEYREGLKKLNLYDKYSYERFIPQSYLFSEIKDRIALLQGLIDTDGYVCPDGKCYFDTSSPQLAKDVAFLVRSLGGTASVSKHKENKHKGHTSVYVVLPSYIMPCRLTRKVNRIASRRKPPNPTRAIESINAAGESECVCISVDAEDGLFLVNDCVVTHNTLTALMLLKYRKQCGDKVKAIVFVPFITSVSTWIDETAKHTPELKCVPLLGNTAENKLKLSEDGDLFVICYQSAVAMMSYKIPGKDGKTEWHILPDEVRKYFKDFNFLICDEVHRCFVAGTLIETPAGAKPIEILQIGDLVETGFGSKKISNIFKSETRQVFTLMLADGSTVECTPNHPFLTDDGWVEAANLKGKHVFKNQEMPNLRQTICKKNNFKILFEEMQPYWAAWGTQTTMPHSVGRSYLHTMWETFFGPRKASQKTLQQILLSQMAHGTARVYRKNNNQRIESKNKCFSQAIGKNGIWKKVGTGQQSKDENEQPNVYTWDAHENFTNSQRKRKWIWGKPWGQWQAYGATKNALGTAWCWLENRVGNKNIQKVVGGVSSPLQGRHWKSGAKNSHRSRWLWPQRKNSKEERLKEKYAAGRVRVVNISFQERNHTTSVFNLEVAGCPYYFANGILVHNCKSATSLTFRLCRTISEQCQWVVGLTGTPFGRNLEDLWPQFYLIDFGETLGHTLGFYKQVFFTRKKGWFTKFEYKFKKKLFPALKKMVKNRSIRYEISELQDMPPKQYVIKILPTPDTSRGYCEDAIKKLREALKHSNYQEIKSNYLKLRQLSSGFMTLKGEDNERLQMSFDENPKLDALQELIEAIPLDCKAIVFHHFVYSNHLISERLTEMKVKHARIWGGQKKPIEELKKFQQDAACRVLVINSKSGSSSLNLQNANYVIFWEEPDSPIDRQQAERRCWRPGQNQRVMIYDLLVRNTVDIQLHESNQQGADLLKSLLDGKATI